MQTIVPEFYKVQQVQEILNVEYQTVRRLVRAGILIASGRGRGCLISATSVRALVTWMEQGGDKWEAPTTRIAPPAAPAPVVRAASGRMPGPSAGGTPSASTVGNASTARLTSKPPLRVLNSFKKN
jgi:hypothetical protein